MKKQVLATLFSLSLAIPLATTASASNVTENSNITITNLGNTGGVSFLNSNDNQSSSISPMATDGKNISYEFSYVEGTIWSSSPLPTNRSGTVTLHVVQRAVGGKGPAVVNYQFSTKDYKQQSSVIQVNGDLTSNSSTITFTNVPKGTASNPVYLYIGNHTSNAQISGNGYTS